MPVQQILNGLAVGGLYAIFALGYTLVFSILGIINFTHTAIFTLGAYFTYALIGAKFGPNGLLANGQLPIALPFILATIGGGLLAGLVAGVIERIAFRPLRVRNADPLLTLVSSLGMAVAIVNIIQYLFGPENYTFPSSVLGGLKPAINFGTAAHPAPVRTIQVIIFIVSIVLVIALTLWINRTRTGKALRAIAEDPTTASLLGIDTDRLILLTFILSGFLGGIAGTLLGIGSGIAGPYFGIAFGLKGLAVIILGGLGDIPGAVLGGLVLGLIESFVPPEFIAYKDAIAFALLFIMLIIRPQGLLGRASAQKV